jgi:hypothetical protein
LGTTPQRQIQRRLNHPVHRSERTGRPAPVARQQGPGPHSRRIDIAKDDDLVALDAGVRPPAPATDAGLVPNAPSAWVGVSDRMPSTYCLSWGVSDRIPSTYPLSRGVRDRNTDVWVGTLARAGRVPDLMERVAIPAAAASAITETTAAIAAR